MPIGAAIGGISAGAAALGAAGIGAAGAIGGSLITAGANKSAASQQAAAAQAAIQEQQQMFGVSQNALNPYIDAGKSVLPTLAALENPGSSAATLQNLPGFKFQSQWGNLNATNALAAEGLGGSGGPLGKALSDYNQGLAGTYYMNSINALQGTANMGEAAGGALAGQATQAGSNIANSTQNQGNALAAGTLGSGNALAGGLTNAANSPTNALLLSKLLNSNTNGLYGGPGPSSFTNGIGIGAA